MTGTASFKDHFSGHSASYARHRPGYPAALFSHLADLCVGHALAWDCATGNGQSALGLVHYFERVVATDASSAQIDAAIPHEQISYHVAPAEASGLEANTVDLITIGQALHWFDLPRFFAEAERVVRAGGIVAAWCYGLCSVNSEVDAVVGRLYGDIVDEFWPPERMIVDRAYVDIDFPAPLIDLPAFSMAAEWSVDDMLGYLRTWSASKRFEAQHGHDPVALVETDLRDTWGSGRQDAVWPMTVCAYRLPD